MADLGPHLTLACPLCKAEVRVEITVVGHASNGHHVLAELDKTEADKHLAECAGRVPVTPPATEPSTTVAVRRDMPTVAEMAGRVDRFLSMRAYITPGNRWCTGCRTKAADCLVQLGRTGAGCCAMCTEGDSHPAPGGQVPCAEWAAEHGAKS